MPYKLDECEAAVRCVDCPHCGAEVGEGCINWHGSAARAHKVRVDKYYSRDIKELLAAATITEDTSERRKPGDD